MSEDYVRADLRRDCGWTGEVVRNADGTVSLVRRCVVFLDIDGVLNRGSDPILGFDYAVPSCIAALNSIAAPGVEIVLTSSWRLSHTLHAMAHILRRWGVQIRVRGFTQDLREVRGSRADEIVAYLDRHDVDGFVILDDEDLCVEREPEPRLVAAFVRTDPAVGLTAELAETASRILAGGTK
jgi:hypothetical protein